jgi:hypothetical protein
MRPYRHPTSHLVRLAYHTGPVRSGRATGVLSGLTQLRGSTASPRTVEAGSGLLPLGQREGWENDGTTLVRERGRRNRPSVASTTLPRASSLAPSVHQDMTGTLRPHSMRWPGHADRFLADVGDVTTAGRRARVRHRRSTEHPAAATRRLGDPTSRRCALARTSRPPSRTYDLIVNQMLIIDDASSSDRARIARSLRLSLTESNNLALSDGTYSYSRACRLSSTDPRPIDHFGAHPCR